MTKAFLQFILLISLFLLTWFALSRINFTGNMDLDQFSSEQEKKLGELLLESLTRSKDINRNDSINMVVDSIFHKICKANKIESDEINVLVIDDSEINAFALPGDHLVVLTGLIKYCKTPEELAGVMAHEMAHIEKDHVMKKLIKEVGISMLFVIAGGNGNFEIIREVLHTVSSRAFDREQESEADLVAVELLSKSKIDPSGLGNFLFRLSQEADDMPDELVIISTHPGSQERSAEILKEKKKYPENYAPLKFSYWDNRTDL